ncbi:MAG TPA: alpha/beta fold hydrolase [Microbacteriaceae bacterium]|nr:alpha/beta fold hydrolase [Microbacteriaceae bacterium]
MANLLSKPIHSFVVGDNQSQNRVVFLHGLFGRGKNFTRIAKGLTPEAQSLMVDLPNHGESGWTKDFVYEQMADLVADHLLNDFASSLPVDVVGHSMGGKVAMILALRHPDLVRRLVVIDMSPVSTKSAGSEFEHLLSSLTSLDLTEVGSRLDAHKNLSSKIPNEGVRGFLLQNLKRNENGFEWEPNLQLLHSQLDTIMDFPEINQSAFIGPVLWVGGERSNYITDADEPAMRALFPLAERLTVAGAGHWVHSEKPAEVIAALRAFLLDEQA